MPELKMMKPEDIAVNEQARKVYDPKDQAELTASVKAYGILQPLLVMISSGLLLAGHRRLIAAIAAGLETVPVIVTDRLLSDSEIRLIQLTENMLRSALSGYEKWLACTEIMLMNPGWQMQDLAKNLNLGASMITRLLSPSKCVELVQNALRDGRIGISDCYAISKLPKSEQAALLALKLGGASRDNIESAGRKKRRTVSDVRLSRIVCPLSNGTKVVVTGPELSLDDLVETLGLVLEVAKKSIKESLDLRTAQAVWKRKANL